MDITVQWAAWTGRFIVVHPDVEGQGAHRRSKNDKDKLRRKEREYLQIYKSLRLSDLEAVARKTPRSRQGKWLF